MSKRLTKPLLVTSTTGLVRRGGRSLVHAGRECEVKFENLSHVSVSSPMDERDSSADVSDAHIGEGG